MTFNLALLIIIGALMLYWQDSLRVRERVLAACKRFATQMDVQFLDQTVFADKVRLARDKRDGRMKIRRHYHFEFSRDGISRLQGEAITLGHTLIHLDMDMPEGRVIEPPTRLQ